MRGKPAVRLKNILGDDVYGLWHVKKIIVEKDGQRYALIPNKQAFSSRDDAEYYAHLTTRRFVERKLGEHNHATVQRRTVIKCLFTATFLLMVTGVAIQWFKEFDPPGIAVGSTIKSAADS